MTDTAQLETVRRDVERLTDAEHVLKIRVQSLEGQLELSSQRLALESIVQAGRGRATTSVSRPKTSGSFCSTTQCASGTVRTEARGTYTGTRTDRYRPIIL